MANHSTSFRGIGRGEAGGWRWVGDRALLLEIAAADLVAANAAARAVAREVRDMDLAEVEDVVPAARTVLVVLRSGAAAPRALAAATAAGVAAPDEVPAKTHEIPIVYGSEAGPDLAEVARIHDLSEAEVVRRHGGALYTVGFLGFAPGFAYLLGLPRELVTPRLATPRTRIPAGSVAIGGEFTGIYPRATPGGWRLIGHTDVELFDPHRRPPALFAPGDHVRFVSA